MHVNLQDNDLVLCRIRNTSKGKESVNVNDEEEYYSNDMSSAVIATDENENAEYIYAGGDAAIETQAAVVGTNLCSIVPPTDQLLVDPLFFVPIRDHPKPKPKPSPSHDSNPSTAAPPQPP